MRTKDKFYENLSNFHVSKEKKVERLELQDVKTLDALSKKAGKLAEDLKKRIKIYIDDEILFEDAVDSAIEADMMIQAEKEELQRLVNEHNKKEEKQEKAVSDARKELGKRNKKADTFEKKANESEQQARGLKSQAEQLVDQMRGAIRSFESSAKALGVDVSGKLSSYESAANKLESATFQLK